MPTVSEMLAEASRLYQSRSYNDSEALYRQVLASGERESEALYGLGIVALGRGDHKTAADWLQRSLDADAGNINALYLLGQLMERAGRQSDAITLFARVLARDPGHQQALNRLAALSKPAQAPPAQPPTQEAPPEPSAATAPPRNAGPPIPPSSPDSFVGVVRGVQRSTAPYRGKPAAQQLLTFLLETTGGAAPEVNLMPVEMRAFEIRGTVMDGHWVEIPRSALTASGLTPSSFRNLSTGGAEVRRVRKIFLAQ